MSFFRAKRITTNRRTARPERRVVQGTHAIDELADNRAPCSGSALLAALSAPLAAPLATALATALATLCIAGF
jgi:hypothetical protein